MRVKVAECAVSFWDQGRLVWDDYLRHRQYALRPDCELVLRWFGAWRELSSIAALDFGAEDDRFEALARHLLDAGVLIAEGSTAHEREAAILAQWRPWGAAAMHYHFASRSLDGTRFLDAEADAARQHDKLAHHRAPAPFKRYDDGPATPLPDAACAAPGLLDALRARRSTRQFASTPVGLGDLATVLRLAGGVTGQRGGLDEGPAILRTSPSAGARAPIEMYVVAARVEGLAPGVYHLDPFASRLEALDRKVDDDRLAAALGHQQWLEDAAALIVYTGVVDRSQWRYETGRAYRDILLGLGHLNQTVLLVAAALGLGSLFATAVCDEELEALLGVDPVGELVLGVTALGQPAPVAAAG